ncbi:hypothetical protein [Rhodoferax aquaticus]|uniref:Tetratricopeptide repeat protein n=1 Tax=Rhodoferax aquaticus TaxID=2527691 RepID=A0A515EL76_9BURK|nr:hypothetical protein [Rhodoferax aquaticus]QDL53415.1 hypothetical protein EXZ61_04060 [Rhodoferax aquaticus]
MKHWNTFSCSQDYLFDAQRVRSQWACLHLSDQEPLPENPDVLAAWALFHSGKFQAATELGLSAGMTGMTVANKATCIYANYLEPKESNKLRLLQEVAERAQEQSTVQPNNANAFYWRGYALGRYSQGISVAKALAQGLGTKVKAALDATIQLQPHHADAHFAMGTFHAEVIDKVGVLIGHMTYGAKKDTCLQLFKRGLTLAPRSRIGLIEYANALVMLEGEDRLADATRLYEQSAALTPNDALEHLDVEMAKAELAENAKPLR